MTLNVFCIQWCKQTKRHCHASSGHLKEVKNDVKQLSGKKMVVITYDRWKFMRGSDYRAVTLKILLLLISGTTMGGGRRWRFDSINTICSLTVIWT